MALYIYHVFIDTLCIQKIFSFFLQVLLFCSLLGIKKCLQTPALLSVLQHYVVQWVYISSLQELQLFLEPKALINPIMTGGGGENSGPLPPLLLPFTPKTPSEDPYIKIRGVS